jgi:hypothetical protein
MQFMVMYKPDETAQALPPSKECLDEMEKFMEDGRKSGVLIMTGGLHPINKGARVRLAKDTFTVTDGPFTEAKEVVAGFAILQFQSKEEAIESARDFLKVAGDGECEIRQLVEPADFTA